MNRNTTAADELFRCATESTLPEEDRLSRFLELLRDLCDACRDPVELFRSLHHVRIRLSHGPMAFGRTQEIAICYIDIELELLARYGGRSETPATRFRWTGTLVELVELIYGLQETGCFNDGQNDIKDLVTFFGSQLGLEIKVRNCYDAYLDIKRRKSDSRTYFLDKMRERLNLRMQRDDEKESIRR